ncbi:hypothetical protein [Hymenobacter pini]|uniref:hypothetical protein n=1 Tax=Hymenobacter pini TaxID=2880879 RepID=UPI001CF3474E|nr:hypothetical protein [Hymenobacter pini]MCA8833317.1 hypothetical protein [Hymenobacter pini]
MHIKEFEELCRRMAEQATQPTDSETATGWQLLARRLDQLLPDRKSAAYLPQQCVDQPGPHGCLSTQDAAIPDAVPGR